jgi:hypothetical protein
VALLTVTLAHEIAILRELDSPHIMALYDVHETRTAFQAREPARPRAIIVTSSLCQHRAASCQHRPIIIVTSSCLLQLVTELEEGGEARRGSLALRSRCAHALFALRSTSASAPGRIPGDEAKSPAAGAKVLRRAYVRSPSRATVGSFLTRPRAPRSYFLGGHVGTSGGRSTRYVAPVRAVVSPGLLRTWRRLCLHRAYYYTTRALTGALRVAVRSRTRRSARARRLPGLI